MNDILLYAIAAFISLGTVYYWYYMNFVFPKKFGIPYVIRFDQIDVAPNIRENQTLKGKIEILSHTPNNMNWLVRSKVINEHVIKKTLMDDYHLKDWQVHINHEARWSYENKDA